MIVLNKENIQNYLMKKLPGLDYSSPLIVSAIGEGSLEDDGDGFLNYVFRVSDGHTKVIVKQGLSQGRVAGFSNLSKDRLRMEYESMRIRESIVPEYLPGIYLYDDENQVLITEDVSHLKIARFQLNKSVIFPNLASDTADYMAKTHFYTSDYYLNTEKFRNLDNHFTNHKMRDIFDDLMFISYDESESTQEYGKPLSKEFISFTKDMVLRPEVVLARYQLKDKFMSKAEALIHGDFHTSNVFIGDGQMKVIDMEYAFCGPMAFDLGYLQANLVSQYICSRFRHYDTKEEAQAFQTYMLATIKYVYDRYCETFVSCWNRDAKEVYQGVLGLQEYFRVQILQDMIGFASTINLSRVVGDVAFPEYDELGSREKLFHAYALSAYMDTQMLVNREKYGCSDEWIEDIVSITDSYLDLISQGL